jgi:peptide/nickel transport system permease protein
VKFTLRLLLIVLSVWIFSRGAIYLLPGDPVDYLVNESLIQTTDEKTISEIHRRMDLDVSFVQRISSLPHSESLINNEPTLPLIKTAFLNSLTLTVITFIFTMIFTVFFLYLGYQSQKWNRIGHATSIFLASIPIFISGPILLFIFSLKLNIFPVTRHPILPAICLALYLTGFWFRSISQKIINYVPQSASMGARARGLDELRVFLYYIILPCAGGLVRFFTSQVGNLLNGSLIVEIIFHWPGLGYLLSDAINKRDYPVIEIGLITVSLITLVSLQIGKWLQIKLEPKQA